MPPLVSSECCLQMIRNEANAEISMNKPTSIIRIRIIPDTACVYMFRTDICKLITRWCCLVESLTNRGHLISYYHDNINRSDEAMMLAAAFGSVRNNLFHPLAVSMSFDVFSFTMED